MQLLRRDGVQRGATIAPVMAALVMTCAALQATASPRPTLEQFSQPPQEFRPMIWWHWVNGNVTREGVEKDLRAMKDAGLGGFHLFDVSMTAPGPLRYGTPEWIATREFALRRAQELGLSAGLHCGPGWSEAGGPWVKPEDSMKYLVWTETVVEGGAVDRVLPTAAAIQGVYHDVAVIAVPCSPDDLVDAGRTRPTIEIEGSAIDATSMLDGDAATACELPKPSASSPVTIRLAYPSPQTVRGLEVALPPGRWPLVARSRLESSADGITFALVREFRLLSSGGIAPIVAVNFAPVTARHFRLRMFEPTDNLLPTSIAEIRLRLSPRVENWGGRSGRMTYGPQAQTDEPAGLAPLAGIAPEAVIDVSAMMEATGRLRWNAPGGSWTVYRFAYTSVGEVNHPAQPEATGLEVDKMDAAAVRDYLDHSLGRELRTAGSPVKMVLADSWEAGAQNWTESFPALFRAQCGYDLRPWLPVLTGRVLGSAELSARFLWDFRQVVSQAVADIFFGTLHRELKARGVTFYGEPYGGPFELSQAGGHADVPMSEFWIHDTEFSNLRNIASLAHATGRPVVAAESFTALKDQASYRLSPADFKTAGDRAFAEGLNQVVLHSFVHQPYDEARPGFSLGFFGSHFTRHETWWLLVRGWTDYLARCQLLLRAGTPVADVAYLRVDDAPGMASLGDYAGGSAVVGRNYDFIAAADLSTAVVADGWLTLRSGVRYRVLVLPEQRILRADVAERLLGLVKQGLQIVGPAPQHNPGLAEHERADRRLAEIRAELWGDLDGAARKSRRVGEGSVWWGRTAGEVLAAERMAPDLDAGDATKQIVFCHRATPEREIYFVANVSEERPAVFTAAFRATAPRIELWDPITGGVTAAAGATVVAGVTALPLELAPRQSIFVVFEKRAPEAAAGSTAPAAQALRIVSVAGPWRLSFAGAPEIGELTVTGPLAPLSLHAEPAVRHFAGIVTYRARLTLADAGWGPGQRAWLDLGQMRTIAAVAVNGCACGTAWVPPYRVEVSGVLREGENELEIKVATPWANRLIGDAALPGGAAFDDEGNLLAVPAWLTGPDRAHSPEARRSFSSFRYYRGGESLVESGLLGPVALQYETR